MTHPSLHALTHPDKVAYRMAESGQPITYGELDRRTNQAARLLRSRGLAARDHLALLMENSLEFLVVCWAAQRSGLFFTAISTHLTPREISHIVRDCGAKAFITSPAQLKIAGESARSLPADLVRLIRGEAQAGFDSWDAGLARQAETPLPDQLAGYGMLYSSGTTGLPKGVTPMFKDEPIESLTPIYAALCRDLCGLGPDSIYLSPAPIYHAAPLRFTMMTAALGGTAIIMEKFEPELFLALIERHRVTHTQLVPTMFVRLLKLPEEVRRRYDISSLKTAVHAAAPCPIEVKARMIEWWGPIFVEYYAGTEACGLTLATCADWVSHPGTVGRAAVGKVRIVGEDGEELPAGEIGAVYFSDGPNFSYHNDPDKTLAAYNDKGWATYGDVGYLDAEGYLYLTDRKAYMIISGGVNIYPQETENVLVNHPQVVDAAVFGIPNAEMGEEVKAVVQLTADAVAGPQMAEALIAFCRQHLSSIKCPRSIDFMTELPRTPTGKLIKRGLRDRYWTKSKPERIS